MRESNLVFYKWIRPTNGLREAGPTFCGRQVGEGRFTTAELRDSAMKFAMNLGCLDAVTIGFKSAGEIDEAIDRMDRVMNA